MRIVLPQGPDGAPVFPAGLSMTTWMALRRDERINLINVTASNLSYTQVQIDGLLNVGLQGQVAVPSAVIGTRPEGVGVDGTHPERNDSGGGDGTEGTRQEGTGARLSINGTCCYVS